MNQQTAFLKYMDSIAGDITNVADGIKRAKGSHPIQAYHLFHNGRLDLVELRLSSDCEELLFCIKEKGVPKALYSRKLVPRMVEKLRNSLKRHQS